MSYSESSSDDVRSILLPDSRVLSYAIYGNTAITAPTIFYFYPYPDSHIGGRIYDTVARDRGIRIIVPDRPGIGRSTFKTWRTIAQWPDDVLQVADAPGVKAETFGVFAVGGGAPYGNAPLLHSCHSCRREQQSDFRSKLWLAVPKSPPADLRLRVLYRVSILHPWERQAIPSGPRSTASS